MDVGTAMSVVQTLFTALQCSELKEFCSIAGYKSQLDQLRRTVTRIQAVLVDAEAKQELSQEEKVYIEELKEAVYEADDLFDEFVTLAQQKKLTKGIKARLFSLFTKLGVAFRLSQKVDKVKKKLDDIAYNNQFSFKHDPEPIKKRSRETCSYVHSAEIIGRENDLETVVGMLLQSDVHQDVSFLTIVGIGGLGKTTLAQLVFNDPRITTAFPLKLWTCVSDQDKKELDEKEILGKILEAATNEKHHDDTKDRVQSQLREQLTERKYLLVLDDVWTENRVQWRKLVDFLMTGQKGSWIVVTTRSHETAKIIGDGLTYELQGLSKENSWCLFKRAAFGSELSRPSEDFINIGRKIVERCANVPLAIKVAGSLLYGQEKRKWMSFQEFGLTKIEENKNDIMPILKLSYHQLESPLKSCFGYCALFPKDSVMKKKTVVRVWMAQGYIISDDEQNMQDVAEEYFLVLLRRCFFQDIVEDIYGDIESFKVHDLMHDVAQEVMGKEICMSDTIHGNIDTKIRHFHLTSSQYTKFTFARSHVRSYLHRYKMHPHSVDTLIGSWKYLRILILIELHVSSLPSSIGELLHLRYLDVSHNDNLKLLPRKITNLYNLQTLLLRKCSHLKELPKDMSRLAKLRVLDIKGCNSLSCMPIGMGKLEYLQELTMFVVGEVDSSWERFLISLKDLNDLRNLKSFLEIKVEFCKIGRNVDEGGRERGYMQNKHLNHVRLRFQEENGDGRHENDEAVIEELQPHFNLKRLDIWCYKGVRMPKWAQEDNLANLVKIEFEDCPNLESLGSLGNLNHLKNLLLFNLQNLEYLIENNTADFGFKSSSNVEFSFFPSLETLYVRDLPKLKGWCRGVGMKDFDQLLRLPQLTLLGIQNCPELIAVVECPVLEFLSVYNVNKKLGIIMGKRCRKEEGDERHRIGGTSTGVTYIPSLKLRVLEIGNIKWLNSQQMEAFQCLQSLKICMDSEVESLGEAEEVFQSCSSSLRSLHIKNCRNLRSVSGGLEYLTALEKLIICNCPNLSEEDSGNNSGMSWQSLSHSMRFLTLVSLPQLVSFPNWIQNLTALQTLEVKDCKKLKMLPNWMSKLTCLRELRFISCSSWVKEICQDSTAENWPHIKHVSMVIKD